MIKFELIKRISEQFGVEEIDAGVFIDGIFESMVNAFKKGKKINIPEFGVFNIINKTVDGKGQRFINFSPANNFANAVNKNFSELKQIEVKALNVKKDDALKLKEATPEDNAEDYLYFGFDSPEIDKIQEDGIDAGLIKDWVFSDNETIQADVIIEEEIPKGTVSEPEIIPQIKSDINSETEQNIFNGANQTERDYFPSEEAVLGNDEVEQIEPAVGSEMEKNIFTESNQISSNEVRVEAKPEQNLFADEIKESILNQQDVFTDNPDNNVSPIKILLSEFSDTKAKIRDKDEYVSHFNVREDLKDDMDIDNIKEEILYILEKREEVIKELNVYNTGAEIKPHEFEYDQFDKEFDETTKAGDTFNIDDISEKPEIVKSTIIEETPGIDGTPKIRNKDVDLFIELEKRIKELDELSQKQDEIMNIDLKAPMSHDKQIFDKIIEETPAENQKDEEPKEISEIIFHENVTDTDPKSLLDSLQALKLHGVIEHLDANQSEEDAKSYDDIFRKSETQFIPQFPVETEEKNTKGRFFKVFLFLFFIFLLTIFSFYIYRTMFNKSTDNQVADTIGFTKIDSVKQLLAKSDDSISNIDDSKLNTEDDLNQTESVEIKNIYGVVYRELGNKIYIQNKVLDDLNDANDLEIKLESSSMNCIVEGATKIDNGLEYRVLVGPFKSIEEAMVYYEKHKVLLNFIQIINPNSFNILVF